MIRLLSRLSAFAILAASVLPLAANALPPKPLSAFQALDIATKVATAEARTQLIGIDGPRSETELYPDVWKFVFYDTNAKQNGRLVTVTRGQVTEIRDGFFALDKFRVFPYKPNEVISPHELKFDSDKALDIVVKSSALQGVRLSSVTFALTKDQDVGQAVWKIEVLADDSGKESDIGYARISADNGGIIELKLDPSKLLKKP